MVDWAEAGRVATSGIVSVFLVLALLQLAIQGSGAVIAGIQKTQAQKEKT